MIRLPRTVAEITPEWLTDALGRRCPGTRVAAVETVHVDWGTATKVRLRVEYAGSADPAAPPAELCVKGPFGADAHAMSDVNDAGSQIEARFFADLAGTLDVPLPRYWFAGVEGGRGIVVLDDLVARGVRFGRPTEPWSPDEVGAGLRTLAAQHGVTWGGSFSAAPWLAVGSPVVRSAVGVLFSGQHWDAHFASDAAPTLPVALRDRERNLRAYEALWKHEDADPSCLVHADAHLGNTYLEPSGAVRFLDWASPGRGTWSYDVAYFLTGALTLEDRRRHEQELLRLYLDTLRGHGGPQLRWDDAWAAYRRHQLHGLIWATVPPVMQPAENVAAMTERYVAAIEDHATFDALGV